MLGVFSLKIYFNGKLIWCPNEKSMITHWKVVKHIAKVYLLFTLSLHDITNWMVTECLLKITVGYWNLTEKSLNVCWKVAQRNVFWILND